MSRCVRYVSDMCHICVREVSDMCQICVRDVAEIHHFLYKGEPRNIIQDS